MNIDNEIEKFELAMQNKFGWNNTLHILNNPNEYSEKVYTHVYYANEGWQARSKQSEAELAVTIEKQELLIAELKSQRERNTNEYHTMHEALIDKENKILELKAQVEALSEDKVRLDWLIANEYQVWETSGKYQIHFVTEHNAITQFFDTARDAIDQAKDNQ